MIAFPGDSGNMKERNEPNETTPPDGLAVLSRKPLEYLGNSWEAQSPSKRFYI
jgi:hypothetical protein